MKRRIAIRAVALVIVTMISTATLSEPALAGDATFVEIQNQDAAPGLCLNTHGATTEGSRVYADDCRTPSNDYWATTDLGNGYHIIRHMQNGARTNLCLTAPSWNADYAMLYRCDNPTGSPYWDQQWLIWAYDGSTNTLPYSAVLYLRSTIDSGNLKCLTAPSWSARRALVYSCQVYLDQRWRLYG